MPKKLPTTLLLPLMFLTWGCVSQYSLIKTDSTTPKTDLATLTIKSESIVKLCKVDGVSGNYTYSSSSDFPCEDKNIYRGEILVEPRPHILTICCVTPGPVSSLLALFPAHNIDFYAEKGKKYLLSPIYKGSYSSFINNSCTAEVLELAEHPR